MFKVALLDQWTVVVSGPKLVDELRKRPDEELSFMEGTEEVRLDGIFSVTVGAQHRPLWTTSSCR